MKVFTKDVFERVERPEVSSDKFKALTRGEQLELVNEYKEYLLERLVYEKTLYIGKSVEWIFAEDREVQEAKKDLALTRYEMLKETRNTDRNYTAEVSRHSYNFDCEKTKDVMTRFEIYRKVKGMSVRPYLNEQEQSSFCFF